MGYLDSHPTNYGRRAMVMAPADEDRGLGQFVEAAALVSSWVGGLFSFGGVPLTTRGKKLADLAKRRGVEKKAAEGWARNYEKEGIADWRQPNAELLWAEQIDKYVVQLNPPITAGEWNELKAAMVAGKVKPPDGWLPTALRLPGVPGGPSIQLPPLPVTPGGGPPPTLPYVPPPPQKPAAPPAREAGLGKGAGLALAALAALLVFSGPKRK